MDQKILTLSSPNKLNIYQKVRQLQRQNKLKNIIEVLDIQSFQDQQSQQNKVKLEQGTPLLQHIDRLSEGLTVNHLVQKLIEVCETLEELHSQNFVHRDVNPNTMIYSKGRIKLSNLDFIRSRGDLDFLKNTKGIIETPQTKEKYKPEPCIDVYQLGLALQALLLRDNLWGQGLHQLQTLIDHMLKQKGQERINIKDVIDKLKFLQNQLDLPDWRWKIKPKTSCIVRSTLSITRRVQESNSSVTRLKKWMRRVVQDLNELQEGEESILIKSKLRQKLIFLDFKILQFKFLQEELRVDEEIQKLLDQMKVLVPNIDKKLMKLNNKKLKNMLKNQQLSDKLMQCLFHAMLYQSQSIADFKINQKLLVQSDYDTLLQKLFI